LSECRSIVGTDVYGRKRVSVIFLSAHTKGWASTDEDEEATHLLDRLLTNVLVSERLAVLAGLGTSLCITNKDGETLAPTMANLWDAAKQTPGEAFAEIVEKTSYRFEGERGNIETLLSRCQMAIELEPDEQIAEFIKTAEHAIVEACRFIQPTTTLDTHETFLRRVARRSTSLPRTQVFTTNYDLAFETAAARIGFAVIDGFSHAHPQRFDGIYFSHDLATRDRERAAVPVDWVPNVIQLHKLHGSVDWARDDGGAVLRDESSERPLIIYPRSSKFEISYQQPFLELMGRFQSALRLPETGLMIVGSGFGDAHIAEPVIAAVSANVRLTVVLVAPGIQESDNVHIKRMRDLIAGGDRRLALLDGTFEEAVPLVPDLVAPTEAERHEERLAAAPGV
jgi:hypothetical protein